MNKWQTLQKKPQTQREKSCLLKKAQRKKKNGEQNLTLKRLCYPKCNKESKKKGTLVQRKEDR